MISIGVKAVGKRVDRAVGQNADDPAAEIVRPVGRVAVLDDWNHISGTVGGHADNASALNGHQDRAGRQWGHRRNRHVQARCQVADEEAPAVVRVCFGTVKVVVRSLPLESTSRPSERSLREIAVLIERDALETTERSRQGTESVEGIRAGHGGGRVVRKTDQ